MRVFQQIALASGDALTHGKIASALGLDGKAVGGMLQSLEDMMLVRSLMPTQFSGLGAPLQQRTRLGRPKLYVAEHGHVSAFARSNDPLSEPAIAARVHETAVYRALRSIRVPWDVREIGFARIDKAEEIDFVVVSDERTVGVEVTSGEWRHDKHAKATAAAKAFGIAGIVVGDAAAPPTAQGLPWIALRDFLLDPIAALEQA